MCALILLCLPTTQYCSSDIIYTFVCGWWHVCVVCVRERVCVCVWVCVCVRACVRVCMIMSVWVWYKYIIVSEYTNISLKNPLMRGILGITPGNNLNNLVSKWRIKNCKKELDLCKSISGFLFTIYPYGLGIIRTVLIQPYLQWRNRTYI